MTPTSVDLHVGEGPASLSPPPMFGKKKKLGKEAQGLDLPLHVILQ